jgi:hypothetical protein
MIKFVRLAALAAAATLVATPAFAAPVAASPKAKASAKIVNPLTQTANRTLDFGTIVNGLAVGGTRTITVSNAGVRGGCDATVVVCSGTPTSAQYLVTGTNNMTINVDTTGSNLPSMPRLDADGKRSFRFGGILRVSGDLDGEFRGDVPIDVEYF